MPAKPERHNDAPFILRLFGDDAYERKHWKLRDVLERFFLDRILRNEREVGVDREDRYRRYVWWWEQLTPNPDLIDVTRDDLREFRARLREATYTRSPVAGAKRYPISLATQADILDGIVRLLGCTGPANGEIEMAEILDGPPPSIKIARPRHRPKPVFTVKRARALAEACWRMNTPDIDGVDPAAWNYAALCCLLLSGARRNTARRLCWWMFEKAEDGLWLDIPDEYVSKTNKGKRLSVHPELWLAINAIRTESQYVLSIDRYNTRKRRRTDTHRPLLSGDRMRSLLHQLHEIADVPREQWLSPQACRRSHFDWLDRTGYQLSRKIAQSAADHSSATTTERYYVDLENRYRRRLPWLRPEVKKEWIEERRRRKEARRADHRQKRLFD